MSSQCTDVNGDDLSIMVRLRGLRQPEYTGTNRCIPCTLVNVALATVGGIIIGKVTSRFIGIIAFAASLGVVYLRGYLVPGTPYLTKQYLPDDVLRWFEKDPTAMAIDDTEPIDGEQPIEPEHVLRTAQAVTPCDNGTDLCLTPDFHTRWRDHINASDEHGTETKAVREMLGAQGDHHSVEEYGDAVIATDDDNVIGQWPSPAAVSVDVAAATELAQRVPDWSQFSPAARARLLMSLRVFIEQCPRCGGDVHVEQELVESCCRSYDVVASVCQECNATLFEIEWDDEPVMDEETDHASPTTQMEV